MAGDQNKPRQVLFVDDEAAFLANLRGIFSALARGKWEIHTAQNHAQALALIQKKQMDLVVLDIGMPVVDGVQFLRLINRTHPGQQVVMLTGHASEEKRKECLDNGALLCLDKPIAPGGYESVFATLDALIRAPGSDGFRGMMRRIGLQEVLQMECLGAKSSVLEIFTGRVRGRIFIHDGVIIHAEQGSLVGEVALYSLLALRGGEFNLLSFTEPPQRTIQGQWEFLLMEAARLQDEAGQNESPPGAPGDEPEPESVTPEPDSDTEFYAAQFATPVTPGEIRIDEVVLCSGAGEVLFDWQCRSLERRLGLLEQVEQQAAQMGLIAPLGRFERVEIHTQKGHAIAQILPDRRLFVRHSGGEE
jgi:CheY-like chemotaxis protein